MCDGPYVRRLHVQMAIDKHRLLGRVVAQLSHEDGRQLELGAVVQRLHPHVGVLDARAQGLQLRTNPLHHLGDLASGEITVEGWIKYKEF